MMVASRRIMRGLLGVTCLAVTCFAFSPVDTAWAAVDGESAKVTVVSSDDGGIGTIENDIAAEARKDTETTEVSLLDDSMSAADDSAKKLGEPLEQGSIEVDLSKAQAKMDDGELLSGDQISAALNDESDAVDSGDDEVPIAVESNLSSKSEQTLQAQSDDTHISSIANITTQAASAIADGAYVVKAKVSYGGQALGTKHSYNSNAAIQAYGASGDYDQIFYFQHVSNNRYAIFSLYSGLALTVSGSNIVQSAYGGGSAQLFEVRAAGGGLYALISQSGKAIATPSANANATAQNYNGAITQKFKLVEAPLVIPGVMVLRSAANTGAAVGVKNSSSAVGAEAQLAKYATGGGSKVLISISGSGYTIRPLSSGLYFAPVGSVVKQQSSAYTWNVKYSGNGNRRGLTLTGVTAGASAQASTVGAFVAIAKTADGPSQSFLPAGTAVVDNGYYVLVSSDGKAIDVSNGSYAAQANIQVYQRNGTGAQVFYLQHIGNGLYLITSSKTYQALDAQNGGTSNSTNIWQYPENRTPAQLWVPTLDSSGKTIFINAKSGKALTMAGSNVRINDPNNSASQRWALVSAKQYSMSGNTALDRAVASILAWHPSLRSAFEYVAYNFNYRDGNKHWSGWSLSDAQTKEYALDMWNNWSGNCYRFASLFAWCARALGYGDVVVRTGWVVGYSAPQAPHGWVVVNGMICDPDMQHEMPSRNWYWQTWASAPTAYYSW